MKSSKRLIRTFLFALALCCVIGWATRAKAATEPQVSIKFQVISWHGVIKDLWYVAGGGKESILALSHMRSVDYSYSGPRRLNFYTDKVDAEGKPVPVGYVDVPPGASRGLLLLVAEGEGYKIAYIEDDAAAFPYGTIKFFNMAPFQVAIKVADQQFILEPKEQKVYGEANDVSGFGVKVASLSPRNGREGWMLGYANTWRNTSDTRTMAFAFENPTRPGTVRLKRIYDKKQEAISGKP